MKNKNYYVPLMLIFCLFFLWAISSNLLPTMIRQLMKTCELNAFEASFTETAYWLAYFICPIPIAMFMKKYSYKSGIIFGLLLAACGGLLFFPAAMLKEYWAYLCIFFIIPLCCICCVLFGEDSKKHAYHRCPRCKNVIGISQATSS